MIQTTQTLSPIIHIDEEKCRNCRVCVRVCPVKFCNIASGDIVRLDHNTCIGCGACVRACPHKARSIIDDCPKFHDALHTGKRLVAIIAPSIAINFPDTHRRILGWLRSKGVLALFDIAFGVELAAKSCIEYFKTHNPPIIISQSCPVITSFLEIHHPEMLPWLLPLGSPMQCMMQMIQTYYPQYADAEIVVFNSCAAKRREFDAVGSNGYVVTFKVLEQYFHDNGIDLNQFPESDFDNPPAEQGILLAHPGGLLNTIARGKKNIAAHTRVIEGVDSVFAYLRKLSETTQSGQDPSPPDCLGCEFGCNAGLASIVIDQSPNRPTLQNNDVCFPVLEPSPLETSLTVHSVLDDYWDPDLYRHTHIDLSGNIFWKIPTEEEIQEIFRHKLKIKSDRDEINCRNCGYRTCRDMAIAIHNNLINEDHC